MENIKASGVNISIMHTVRRRQNLCIIKNMRYWISHELHEFDSLKSTTDQKKYQWSSAFLPACSSSEDGLGIRATPLQTRMHPLYIQSYCTPQEHCWRYGMTLVTEHRGVQACKVPTCMSAAGSVHLTLHETNSGSRARPVYTSDI